MSYEPPAPTIISPAQCRAARAALDMTALDVCAASEVSNKTLAKFEDGGEVRASVAERLRRAFEAKGVTLHPDGRGIDW